MLEVFGAGARVRAIDDRLELTGAHSRAHEDPHERVEDSAAQVRQGGAEFGLHNNRCTPARSGVRTRARAPRRRRPLQVRRSHAIFSAKSIAVQARRSMRRAAQPEVGSRLHRVVPDFRLTHRDRYAGGLREIRSSGRSASIATSAGVLHLDACSMAAAPATSHAGCG